MKKDKVNTNTFKTFRQSLIPAIFTASYLMVPFTCLAANFAGTLDGVSITDAQGTNAPPTASFTYTMDGDIFNFDASSSTDIDGNIVEYRWDFGDATTETGPAITHQFTAEGAYPVTLTIVDNNGGVAISQSQIELSLGFVIEDAEDGTTAGWSIYDSTPEGATITNVFDSDMSSNVIEVIGYSTDNGFQLRNSDGTYLQYSDSFVFEWSMKLTANYRIYIMLKTTAGDRYLVYTEATTSSLGASTYVYHGLDADSKDGSWHTITRDLQADLQAGQPNVDILEVNAFMIRGSGRFDNLRFK